MSNYQHILSYHKLSNSRPNFQSFIDPIRKRYYSGTDVSIYFGDFYIDDAIQVTYELSESTMLLYGYNSFVFDDVAKGSRMVQGQFSIHFTKSCYLLSLLSDLSELQNTGVISHSRYHAVWPTSFDLYIKHGTENDLNALQILILKNVYITGVQTRYDATTGEPIAEVYSFIGQDVICQHELENNINDSNNQISQDIKPTTIKIVVYDQARKNIKIVFDQPLLINKAFYKYDQQVALQDAHKSLENTISDTLILPAQHDFTNYTKLYLSLDYTIQDKTFVKQELNCIVNDNLI